MTFWRERARAKRNFNDCFMSFLTNYVNHVSIGNTSRNEATAPPAECGGTAARGGPGHSRGRAAAPAPHSRPGPAGGHYRSHPIMPPRRYAHAHSPPLGRVAAPPCADWPTFPSGRAVACPPRITRSQKDRGGWTGAHRTPSTAVCWTSDYYSQ